MRRRAKTDSNHLEIMNAFRRMGCTVHSTHQLGGGFPDLVIGYMGLSGLVEVKDGSLAPSARKLTPDEEEFHNSWSGSLDIAENLDDVERIVKLMRIKAIKIGVLGQAVEQVRAYE